MSCRLDGRSPPMALSACLNPRSGMSSRSVGNTIVRLRAWPSQNQMAVPSATNLHPGRAGGVGAFTGISRKSYRRSPVQVADVQSRTSKSRRPSRGGPTAAPGQSGSATGWSPLICEVAVERLIGRPPRCGPQSERQEGFVELTLARCGPGRPLMLVPSSRQRSCAVVGGVSGRPRTGARRSTGRRPRVATGSPLSSAPALGCRRSPPGDRRAAGSGLCGPAAGGDPGCQAVAQLRGVLVG